MTAILSQLTTALADRYRIDREIGAGGMATVYLGRDIKHDRLVAIKVLNPELGAVLGVERFLAEIKVTANLQHPNLLPLFDSGEATPPGYHPGTGLLFYVMPYVEGETLRQRLDREKQLPVDEAVRIAVAVASALDYAHRRGVIHRDLKPENILLQDGQPVIADFGIALAISKAGGERVTQTGLSLGTPQYMSPEQATGDRVIDARTDVYSLGAVTYEMLTGEPPHTGNTAQAIIARLMTEEPRSITAARRTVPVHVDEAVRCALEKLPADRFATAAQFADALNGGTTTHPTPRPRTARAHAGASRLALATAATSIALAGVFAALWLTASRAASGALQFALDLPPNQTGTTLNESAVAISPDGMTVAYLARSIASNSSQIFIRRLDSLASRPEAFSGHSPLFSSDGKWIYYKTPTDIVRAPLAGGNPEVVVRATNWQGYSLGPRDQVVFAASGSIWRVASGKPVLVIAADTARGESSLADPFFLDENTVVYWIQHRDGSTANGLGVTTLAGGEHSILNVEGSRVFAMVENHLLLGTEQGRLLAYPVDRSRRRVTGPPVVLLDSAVWITTGGVQASLARDGTLAYLRGISGRSLALIEKHGGTIAEAPQFAEYAGGALSPDGKRVAVSIVTRNIGGANTAGLDLWTWEIESNSLSRFTSTGGLLPEWSRDGSRIVFLRPTSPFEGDIVWAPADGSAPPAILFKAPAGMRINGFTLAMNDRRLLLVVRDTNRLADIYSVDLGGDRVAKPLVASSFSETSPAVSSDGRWLAYTSTETGRPEVYVRPLATPAGRVRITNNGGNNSQWLRGGSRLVYGDGGRRLIAEVSQAGDQIAVVPRDTLAWQGSRQSVDATGQRMVVLRDPPGWRFVIAKNWLDEVRRKLRGH
jgi:eukaryotic-like serine/threonine-protein kinase